MRTLLAGLLAATLGVAAGCAKPPQEAPKKVVPVEVAPVRPGPMADRLMIRAATEPWRSVRLSAEVAGRLVFNPSLTVKATPSIPSKLDRGV